MSNTIHEMENSTRLCKDKLTELGMYDKVLGGEILSIYELLVSKGIVTDDDITKTEYELFSKISKMIDNLKV